MSEISKIKVIVADDHPVYRKGIVSALKNTPFISKFTEAANGEEVLKHLENEHHDVILMDIRMAPMDGIQTTKLVSKKYPAVKVIVLSSYDDYSFVIASLTNGASGYLLKSADRQEIILAIKTVFSGKTYYANEVELLVHQSTDRLLFESDSDEKLLSIVYREIIFLICHELTNKEIANALFKSVRTIETYRAEILKLTNTQNGIGLFKFASKRGIMDDHSLRAKFHSIIKL